MFKLERELNLSWEVIMSVLLHRECIQTFGDVRLDRFVVLFVVYS